jgi:hypothetical protein
MGMSVRRGESLCAWCVFLLQEGSLLASRQTRSERTEPAILPPQSSSRAHKLQRLSNRKCMVNVLDSSRLPLRRALASNFILTEPPPKKDGDNGPPPTNWERQRGSLRRRV